jgi:fructose-1,6-bisphosphatase/inositol monophosphatase family enzyme
VSGADRTVDPDELVALARALVEVGRDVRRGVGEHRGETDAEVVRTAGGDDVFGVDARADEVLIESLRRRCGARWPGSMVIEGFDDDVAVGDGGPWRYLADPVDGSRPWLWGKRSAYVLLGAGREAEVLDDLEVGACVELPTARAALALSAAAVRGHGVEACDDIVAVGGVGRPVELEPLEGVLQDHSFVTVASYAVGTMGRLGAWQDDVLDGLHVYDDPYICSGGLLMEVACGRQAAVLDPRPAVVPDSMATHPYDLAAWVVAAEAGVVVESLDGSPLRVPLDTSSPVSWAAYANEEIAAELRARIAAVGLP